jgi:hypothetical protein
MPQADDDYRKRLAQKKVSLNKQNRETAFAKSKQMPSIVKPNYGLIPIGPLDRFAERNAQGRNRLNLASMGQTGLRPFNLDPALEEAAMGAIGPVGGANFAGKATVAALQSKPLRAALEAAEEFGTTSFMDEVVGTAGYKAEDAVRYAQPAREKLLSYLDERLASGEMDVKAANRFVKALPYYLRGDGPDAALQFAGGKADVFNRMMGRADDAQMEIDRAMSGMGTGARRYGPQELVDYLLGEMPKAQSRIKSVLDEWY